MGDTNGSAYLVRGGRIYDHDADVHQPQEADLLIEGETIVRVAPHLAVSGNVQVIEASGKLLVPGLVNAHYHSHDVLAKALFEEMPFDVWTLHSNPGNFGPRSLEEVRLRTLIGAAELLRNGVTTVQDFLTLVPQDGEYVDVVLAAYEQAGIRVVFSLAARDRAALDIAPFMSADVPESVLRRIAGEDRTAQSQLDFIAGQIRRLGLNPTPRQSWALAPSAPQRCTPELLEGIAALSRENNLPVLTHVYETRIQAAAARQHSASASLLKILDRAGLMNERLGVVHGVWLAPEDIELLATSRARVVHNPVSNLKLKSGVAPILDLYRAGIDIALGCDNYSCAETQNIFIAMKLLCLLPAVTDPAPGPITAQYALRCATLAGAKVLGLEGKVGALKEGMAADLMLLDLNEPSFVPLNSAARQIVFAECGRAVETVFVAGRPVVKDRKLVNVDEAALADEAARICPGFRREVDALARRNEELLRPILAANHRAWGVALPFDRYVGRPKEE